MSVILFAIGGAAALGWVDIPGISPAPVGQSGPISPTTATLGYSVAIGTFQESDVAVTRVATISDAKGIFLTVAPVAVDGTELFRVLAGPAIDSASADALADRIAAETGADRSDWVVRETPHAFLLEELQHMDIATLRLAVVRRTLGRSVYLLAVDYSDGTTRYRVYAGAYSDERDASYFRGLLQDLGFDDATLSIRLGRLP